GFAASGGIELRAVFPCQGAGKRTRAVVAGGGGRGRLRAAFEIYRASVRTRDCDLASGCAEAAALAAHALAISRRALCLRLVCPGGVLELPASLGLVPEADRGAGRLRGFSPALHRRTGTDPDRVCDAAGFHPGRDGAARPVSPQGGCASGARADRRDVLD